MNEVSELKGGVKTSEVVCTAIDPEDHLSLAYYFVGLCNYDTPLDKEGRELNSSLKGLRSLIRLHRDLGYPIPVEDLTQAATEGVFEAAEDFDPEKGSLLVRMLDGSYLV